MQLPLRVIRPLIQAKIRVQSVNGGEDMGLLPIKWGSVLVNDRVGHCSFTSEDADVPKTVKIWDVKGRHHVYSGLAYLLYIEP